MHNIIECLPGWLGMWSSTVLAACEGAWPSLIPALIFRNRSMLTSSLFPMLNKPVKKFLPVTQTASLLCLLGNDDGGKCVVLPFTWMQVSEAVQSQTLNVETHLELERRCLQQRLSEQPAVLLSCNSTDICKHTHQQIIRNQKQKQPSWK